LSKKRVEEWKENRKHEKRKGIKGWIEQQRKGIKGWIEQQRKERKTEREGRKAIKTFPKSCLKIMW
jgi:hypothetical protein